MRESSLETDIRERIDAEREERMDRPADELWTALRRGDDPHARAGLLYFSSPRRAEAVTREISLRIERSFEHTSEVEQQNMLRFLTMLAIDLESFVVEWGLSKALSRNEIDALAEETLRALESHEERSPKVRDALLERLTAETATRFRAEGAGDNAEPLARALVGESLSGYARRLGAELHRSSLRAACSATACSSGLSTEVGNDYADFLQYSMWLGGSFATTNPVLIKLAWDLDPAYWDREVDAIIRSRLSVRRLEDLLAREGPPLTEAIEEINTFLTISVVERNCRLLRPIFLLTGGKRGYVSLQVNPRAHGDWRKMASDATAIYQEIGRRLGGVPNVVIKVPSTAAGLRAAEELTGRGIGVTITLTFSLFQALRFAPVLANGQALVSYIAVMNGRLAFPVRDELKGKSIGGGEGAARWAGVEVARKIYRRIYASADDGGLGIDPDKVKLMIASLRIYGDWIPDISELWGVPLSTVFPNVRRSYDLHSRPFDAAKIHAATPKSEMALLLRSEIFRQAWWTDEEEPERKPDRPLSLDESDRDAVAAWAPVAETLGQFISAYKEMSALVKERLKANLAAGNSGSGQWRA